MINTKLIMIVSLLINLSIVYAFIDIPIEIQRSNSSASYNIQIEINSLPYRVSLSLSTVQEYIKPFAKINKVSKSHQTHKNPKNIFGLLKATSLEGYNLQGWKRYFMEALLYIEQRYYHEITINLDWIQKKDINSDLYDGIMGLGPKIQENKLFLEIQKNTQFIGQNIIAIYNGASGKNARIQLGGYDQSLAIGHKNGILFYEIPLEAVQGSWVLPIQKVSCLRQRNDKWDQYLISQSAMKPRLNISSQYIILPQNFKSEIIRNFQTANSQCYVDQQIFKCKNMSSIQLSLSSISLKFSGNLALNISLYDLRNEYLQKTKEHTFFIKFSNNQADLQISEALLKAYYIVIHLDKHIMLYSPINRFPQDWFSSVYVIRFIVLFIVFTAAAAIFAGIWQTFTDPYRKNRFVYGQEGVRLVTYQRADQNED